MAHREWADDNHLMPRGVHVKFDNLSIGRSLRNSANQHHESILIRPTTANFIGNFNTQWSRLQLPLTPCWAIRIHKVQGMYTVTCSGGIRFINIHKWDVLCCTKPSTEHPGTSHSIIRTLKANSKPIYNM